MCKSYEAKGSSGNDVCVFGWDKLACPPRTRGGGWWHETLSLGGGSAWESFGER